MSRIGKLPVEIPNDIKLEIKEDLLSFSYKDKNVSYNLCRNVSVEYKDDKLFFIRKNESRHSKAEYGTDRSNVNNIISGLKSPFITELEVTGVGYKFEINKNLIILNLGFSHDIFYSLPDSVTAEFQKPNILLLKSSNKLILGQVASQIISFRKTEPYKGKGIKRKGDIVLKKEGKKK
jgi:large subunit ribosomal protein L6